MRKGRRTSLRADAPAVAALLVLALLACGGGDGTEEPEPDRVEPPRSLLLITLDTLRADRLGSYGYDAAETPHLDQLAAEGARFARAVSSTPLTLPSHATLLTGRFPMGHGVRDNGTFHLAARHETLAEILKARGYDTAAFVSAFVIDSRFGLDQGFDVYDDFDQDEEASEQALRALSEVQRRGGDTARRVLAWLDGRTEAEEPFFLWVHLYDPHYPFDPPQPFRGRFPDDPYDGEVAYTDSVVGRILGRLERRGLEDETLVIVVGDHGESLGEHGEDLHSWFVYDSVLLVPLLVRMPGRVAPGQVVEEPVRLADVAPTALALLGAPRATYERMHGRSLAPWLTGAETPTPLPAYAESLVASLQFGWGELRAVRARGYKFIDAPRPELYELTSDPGEENNLVGERAGVARELSELLDAMSERYDDEAAAPDARLDSLDEETLRRLESLGYLATRGGNADPATATVDPKDRIGTYQRLNRDISQATDALDARRPERAIELLTPLAREVPGNVRVHSLLGEAYLASGDFSRAARELEVAVARDPRFFVARANLARALLFSGDSRRAAAALEEALEIQPDHPWVYFQLGFVLHRSGRLEEALGAYERSRAVGGDHASLLSNLGMLQLQTEAVPDAVRSFESLVELAPADGLHWNNLGLAYVRADRLDDAGRAFERAVALAPEELALRRNLALWLERVGRAEAAADERRRIESIERDRRH